MNRLHSLGLALCVFLATGSSWAHAQGKTSLESAPALAGTELVRAQLLKGPFHKVAEPVKVEGHLGRFVIESKFGSFSVHGANLLATRVTRVAGDRGTAEGAEGFGVHGCAGKIGRRGGEVRRERGYRPGQDGGERRQGRRHGVGSRRPIGQVRRRLLGRQGERRDRLRPETEAQGGARRRTRAALVYRRPVRLQQGAPRVGEEAQYRPLYLEPGTADVCSTTHPRQALPGTLRST